MSRFVCDFIFPIRTTELAGIREVNDRKNRVCDNNESATVKTGFLM